MQYRRAFGAVAVDPPRQTPAPCTGKTSSTTRAPPSGAFSFVIRRVSL